jgi:hypothetical protein
LIAGRGTRVVRARKCSGHAQRRVVGARAGALQGPASRWVSTAARGVAGSGAQGHCGIGPARVLAAAARGICGYTPPACRETRASPRFRDNPRQVGGPRLAAFVTYLRRVVGSAARCGDPRRVVGPAPRCGTRAAVAFVARTRHVVGEPLTVSFRDHRGCSAQALLPRARTHRGCLLGSRRFVLSVTAEGCVRSRRSGNTPPLSRGWDGMKAVCRGTFLVRD